MVQAVPRSSIDHILLAEGSPFELNGLEADYDSVVVTDHAVVSGFLHLSTPTTAELPRRPPKPVKQTTYKELMREDILTKFQERVQAWHLEPVGNAREAGASLLRLALRVTSLAHRLTKRGPQRRQGWSPIFVALQAYERFLIHVIRLCRPRRHLSDNKRLRKIEEEKIKWHKTVVKVADDLDEYKSLITACGRTPGSWTGVIRDEAYDDALTERRRIVSKLHGRLRTEMRIRVNQHLRRNERMREAGKIGAICKSLMGKEHVGFDMCTLAADDLVMTDPTRIHQRITSHFEEWHRQPERFCFGLNADGVDPERFLREKAYFDECMRGSRVPDEHIKRFRQALVAKEPGLDHADETGRTAREKIAEEMRRPIEYDEFIRHVRKPRKGKAPGMTGLTYEMIRALPEEHSRVMFSYLAAMYEEFHAPQWFKDRWLCPLPKKENPTVDDLRPISLLETLRKLWLGLIMRRFTNMVKEHELLDHRQHGGIAGRSCETALMRLITNLEESEERFSQLHIAQLDIKRAFDSVSFPLRLIGWLRMGIPLEIARYLVEVDVDAQTVVRTPYATLQLKRSRLNVKTLSFRQSRGCGQGDTPSPLT